ncbi:MAG: hypothetical protein ABL977_04315 [Candidatus Eisenbacteria bacterium]
MNLRAHESPAHAELPSHAARILAPFAVAVLALLALATPANGAVPSAANSTVPDCLALCPFGDLSFVVTVRDLAANPITGSTVVLDFSNCPLANLCVSVQPPGLIVNPGARTIRGFTDATGSITFPAHVGGTGPAGSVRLFADGVLFRSYALASPDQDGDGVVTTVIGLDGPLFNGRLGGTDPAADFDCSGHVDAADETIFFEHQSQACGGFVDPARRSTWGAVKLHYR